VQLECLDERRAVLTTKAQAVVVRYATEEGVPLRAIFVFLGNIWRVAPTTEDNRPEVASLPRKTTMLTLIHRSKTGSNLTGFVLQGHRWLVSFRTPKLPSGTCVTHGPTGFPFAMLESAENTPVRQVAVVTLGKRGGQVRSGFRFNGRDCWSDYPAPRGDLPPTDWLVIDVPYHPQVVGLIAGTDRRVFKAFAEKPEKGRWRYKIYTRLDFPLGGDVVVPRSLLAISEAMISSGGEGLGPCPGGDGW